VIAALKVSEKTHLQMRVADANASVAAKHDERNLTTHGMTAFGAICHVEVKTESTLRLQLLSTN
jgi:hypothetical protein